MTQSKQETIDLSEIIDYTVAPNKLIELIMRRQFSYAEAALAFCVLRLTLGYVSEAGGKTTCRKLWNEISLTKFHDETGLARRHVVAGLNSLADKKIIEIRTQQYLSTGKHIYRDKNLYRIHHRLIVFKGAK